MSARAIILPPETSPVKGILTSTILAIRVNCGKIKCPWRRPTCTPDLMLRIILRYQATEFVAEKKQDLAKSKGAAALSMAGQLEKEARLSRQDSRHFLRMKAVKETSAEFVQGSQAQNDAAHVMAVFLVVYYLIKNFWAFPDPLAEQIIHKIFRWTLGKSVQEALDSKDCRELTSTGAKEEAGRIFQNLLDEEMAFSMERRVKDEHCPVDSLVGLIKAD